MSISKFLDTKALKGAKASGGNRNYFRPGEFLTQVEGVKFDETRKKVGFFAAQFKLISAAVDDPKDAGVMAVGKTVDFYCGSDSDWYLGNIKQLLEAITGYTQDEIDTLDDKQFEEVVENLFGSAQGAAGQFVYVMCRAGVTKTGKREGQPNAIPNFHHPKPEHFAAAGLEPPVAA